MYKQISKPVSSQEHTPAKSPTKGDSSEANAIQQNSKVNSRSRFHFSNIALYPPQTDTALPDTALPDTALSEQVSGDSSPVDVQGWLMDEHWEQKLQEKYPGQQNILAGIKSDNKFWQKNKQKKLNPRKIEDILKVVGKQLLEEIEKKGTQDGQLKLYRAMEYTEAERIIQWSQQGRDKTEKIVQEGNQGAKEFRDVSKTENMDLIIPVKNHLGGIEQAEEYHTPQKNALVEFTLKPGAHEILFTPEYMAIAEGGKGATRTLATLGEGSFPRASKGEGVLGGYVGVKSEQNGPFSLSLGDSDATKLLFQLFIEKVKIIKK